MSSRNSSGEKREEEEEEEEEELHFMKTDPWKQLLFSLRWWHFLLHGRALTGFFKFLVLKSQVFEGKNIHPVFVPGEKFIHTDTKSDQIIRSRGRYRYVRTDRVRTYVLRLDYNQAMK